MLWVSVAHFKLNDPAVHL